MGNMSIIVKLLISAAVVDQSISHVYLALPARMKQQLGLIIMVILNHLSFRVSNC